MDVTRHMVYLPLTERCFNNIVHSTEESPARETGDRHLCIGTGRQSRPDVSKQPLNAKIRPLRTSLKEGHSHLVTVRSLGGHYEWNRQLNEGRSIT